MASSSGRKSGSSGRPGPRKRVVIGANETVRVRYNKNEPTVEAERKKRPRTSRASTAKPTKDRPNASAQARRISNAKRDERERRQRTVKFKLYGLAAGAVLLVVLLIWGLVALYQAPIFSVKQVVVEGNKALDTPRVLALAQVPADTTLLRLPAGAIEKGVKRSPWVAKVELDRDFPSTLRIKITERAPAVVFDQGGTDLWMVARDGVWLGKVSEVASDTVVVRDLENATPRSGRKTMSKELLNAIRIATGLSPELKAMTRAISAPTVDKTAIITQDDVEIFVGPATELAKKDRIARSILAKHKGRVVYINVRVTENATWRGLDSNQ